MSSLDPTKEEKVVVQDIMDLPSTQQAEIIADEFSRISNLYKPLKPEDVEMPSLSNSKPLPLFEPHQIHEKISKMKKKASTVCGDIPWRIITEYSIELSFPLSNIYNSCSLEGVVSVDYSSSPAVPVSHSELI